MNSHKKNYTLIHASGDAIESFPTIADALYAARLSAEDEPAAPVRIIIFGSFVTVGEALEVFAKEGLRR